MRLVLSYLIALAQYVGVVAGGVTLFLILAPLVGYLPYSDRPGPGWYGSFPALGFSEFFANAWSMLGYGLFLAALLIIPGALVVGVVLVIRSFVAPAVPRRTGAALVAAAGAGYWMLGAGWYIAAAPSLLVLSVLLGAIAGVWLGAATKNRPEVATTPETAKI